MNEIVTTQQTAAPVSYGSAVRAIVPQNFEQVCRLAEMIAASGMAPKGIDTPPKIAIAIMHGLEVGFTPLAALQSIAVVNGRASIWGDGAIALVRASGLCGYIREWIEGEGDRMVATCETIRKGEVDPVRRTYSMEEAKKANLAGKDIWKAYPKRMLQMRARAFALRDAFADVLRGLAIAEEMQDVERAKEPAPPPPPPPAALDAPPPSPPAPFDVDAGIAALADALAEATTQDQVKAAWSTHSKALWPHLNDAQRAEAQKAAAKRRDELAPPPADDPAPFSIEALAETFDARAALVTNFDALEAVWEEIVAPAEEAGLFSTSEKESVLVPVYEKHQARIDDIFPMDRG